MTKEKELQEYIETLSVEQLVKAMRELEKLPQNDSISIGELSARVAKFEIDYNFPCPEDIGNN